MSESIIVPQAAELRKPLPDGDRTSEPTLADLYPEEVVFFKQKFIWSSNRQGFYTRHRYHPVTSDSGNLLPKWQPFKRQGGWQPLYAELVDSLAEKHLDFERFCRTCPLNDRLKPSDSESAFWLGTMAGKRTSCDCLDLDSHDVIGWASLPTRWHPDRTGWPPGPYDYRIVPIVRPSLAFFMQAKLVYDHFPGRIWAFSSANLGFAVWKIRSYDEPTDVAYNRVENLLEGLEHYPLPARSENSLGRPHRRPCGMDSGVLTCSGLVTDPIEQIRLFMRPPRTPSFSQILDTYWSTLRGMYSLFLEHGVSVNFKRMQADEKKALFEKTEQTIQEIQEWASQGCVIDQELVRQDGNTAKPETRVVCAFPESDVPETVAPNPADLTEHPQYFYDVDLKAVAASGQWVQFVKFLVENGFPREDKFSEAVSALGLWFGFVECFGQDRDRIKELLVVYVSRLHNDKVSRLLAGEEQEVVAHVGRIVDHALANEDDEGKRLFAEIRQKRASGRYQTIYTFAPQILGRSEVASPSPISHPTPTVLFIMWGTNSGRFGSWG